MTDRDTIHDLEERITELEIDRNHLQQENQRLRKALGEACCMWDADNLTTQTYLREWEKLLKGGRR